MHELSLIHDLLRKIEQVAREHQASRISGVTVRLGALSHISADHFREHFVEGVSGTLAEGAQLEIEVTDNPNDPHAQDILLVSVDVEP